MQRAASKSSSPPPPICRTAITESHCKLVVINRRRRREREKEREKHKRATSWLQKGYISTTEYCCWWGNEIQQCF